MEMLSVGLIKYLISVCINKTTEKYITNVAYKENPELIYYLKKDNKFKKTLFNAVLFLLYCIPGFSNILLTLNVSVATSCAVYAKKHPEEIVSKLKENMIDPSVKLSRMDYNRTFYNAKAIEESLYLEGAFLTEIDKMIKDSKKEVDSIDYEDDNIYCRIKCRDDNLKLLRKYSKKVENAVELYQDTKDLKITDISITDSDLERLIVHLERLEGKELDEYLERFTKVYKLK